MPSKVSKPAPKRKAPAFKPPRPASKSTKTSAPRRKSAPTPRGRPSFIADQASASEDDDDDMEDQDEGDGDEDDEIPSDTQLPSASGDDESDTSIPVKSRTNTTGSSQDIPPTIPPALLTRLLHHHFKDSKMRIGKDANGVAGKYMETFVREAIARAAFERSEAAAAGVGGGLAGDFLEVSGLWTCIHVMPN